MKNSITFLLILMAFSFAEVKAQQGDSTVRLPLMKSKSQIFIAKIQTDLGIQKGILYDADEKTVTILDSAYQKVSIDVASIKSIELRRSNALWYGFRAGFSITEIPVLLITSASSGYALVVLVVGTGFSLFVGGTFLLLSAIPSMSIDIENHEDYIDKLSPLRRHSQVYLLKKSAPKLRMRT
jgi:hypothetical protein